LVESSLDFQKQQQQQGGQVDDIPYAALAAQAAYWFENPTFVNPNIANLPASGDVLARYPKLELRARLDGEQQIVSAVKVRREQVKKSVKKSSKK
jgi:hypothetical protein